MVSQKQLSSKFWLLSCALLLVAPTAVNGQGSRARAGARPAGAQRPAAARPGAPRGPQVSSAQITAYLNRLRGKLINAWLLPDGNNHVTVSGNFNQDGLSDNLRPSSSPKNGPAEDAAMQAFNKCMPLEAMPSGITNAKITIDFTSSADPHGDSKSNISLRLDPIQAPKTEAPAQSQAAPVQSQAAPAAPEPAQVQTAAPATPATAEPAQVQTAAPAAAAPAAVDTTTPVQTAAPAAAAPAAAPSSAGDVFAPAQTAAPAAATPAQVPSAPATPVAPAADATQLQPGPAGALTEPAK